MLREGQLEDSEESREERVEIVVPEIVQAFPVGPDVRPLGEDGTTIQGHASRDHVDERVEVPLVPPVRESAVRPESARVHGGRRQADGDGGQPTSRRARRRAAKSERLLTAHASFLQFLFRALRRVARGPWGARGCLRGVAVFRPITDYRCRGGGNLAPESEFSAQKARGDEVLSWYRQYVRLLQQRRSGRAPRSYHPYSGGGVDARGVRAAGGVPFGSDRVVQLDFVRGFGAESFCVLDATASSEVLARAARVGADVLAMSPPCQAYSTLATGSEAPKLIALCRDQIEQSGLLGYIENVKGSSSEMRENAVLIYGSDFGLHVDRPRFLEANFPLVIDDYLREGGSALRMRGCLGDRRKWPRLDPFGRPDTRVCCQGNLFPVQGLRPFKCSVCEASWAMGVSDSGVSYEALAQGIPPQYAELAFGQACMHLCATEFGAPAITFDEMRKDPRGSRSRLKLWLRGAGGLEADLGMQVEAPLGEGAGAAGSRAESGILEGAPMGASAGTVRGGEAPASEADVVWEVESREVHYSLHGGFGQCWPSRDSPTALAGVVPEPARSGPISVEALEGENSLLGWQGPGSVASVAEIVIQAVKSLGTRAVVEARSHQEEALLASAGFSFVRRIERGEPVLASDDAPARLPVRRSWWALGERRSVPPSFRLDLDAAEAALDPRDRGEFPEEAGVKEMRSCLPLPHDASRWEGTGLDQWVETMMQEGVRIQTVREPPFADHPFYRWESTEAMIRAISEADRHLLVGALEYVPEEDLEFFARGGIVHPWVVARQGSKWRLCHDYSVGTNQIVPTAPFSLPSVWDVRAVLKEGSYMAKYDIRDGFFHVPVHPDSRHHLVTRHPGTGRLLRACRLPFGYVDSPRLFCGLMESIANKLRRKAAGRGIHFFVFVDDWLCVGDTEALTIEGCSMLEAELLRLGIEWAPHKHRGPARCMEFLGFLLSNLPGQRSVSLTRKRRAELMGLVDEWLERVEGGGPLARHDPRELAQLLGKLVFASQVVWNGRPYMQAMLSSFAGCQIDWRRGEVTFEGRSQKGIRLDPAFLLDLRWWRRHLSERYSVPWEGPAQSSEAAVVAGTDASGWGTGQLVWLDGGREETQLEFTHAERRRPINWRELLGVLRVVEHFGPRLRGRTVMIETDNMAAKGAASKRRSHARDMQELVRRLVDACERFSIRLRLTHTPGAKLDRPDHTSRGDPVEEPRQRLRREVFSEMAGEFGPFTGFVGAERGHVSSAHQGLPPSSVDWMHPTFGTVGSALRLCLDRAATALQDGRAYRACMLLPVPEKSSPPLWEALLRHFAVARYLEAGSPILEEARWGQWHPCSSQRRMLIATYPRAAGESILPLYYPPPGLYRTAESGAISFLRMAGMQESQRSPVVQGPGYSTTQRRLMLPAAKGSFFYSRGADGLHGQLLHAAENFDGVFERDDYPTLHAKVLLLEMRSSVLRAFEKPVFAESRGSRSWPYGDPYRFFRVDSLVREVPRAEFVSLPRDYVKRTNAQVTLFEFDWEEAERQISALMLHLTPAEAVPETPATTVRGSDQVDTSWVEVSGAEVSSRFSGGGDEDAPAADVEVGDLVRHLGDLGMGDAVAGSVVAVQSEGRLEGSRVRHGSKSVPTRAAAELLRIDYAGTKCQACHSLLGEFGEMYRGRLIHPACYCRALVDERCQEVGGGGRPTTNVPLSMQSRVMSGGGQGRGSLSFATPSVSSRTCPSASRDAASASLGSVSVASSRSTVRGGSVLKRTSLEEDLSPARVGAIRRCLEGGCPNHQSWGPPVKCQTCDRSLHFAECGDLGTARAKLGVLRCMFCRAQAMVATREVTETLLQTAARTMILELTQNAETTAAGYSDFDQLERRFVLEHGLEGDRALLPRHSREAFLNFLTWMSIDAGRVRSLETMWRTMGTMFEKLSLVNFTKDKGVQAHYNKLKSSDGSAPNPDTPCTQRMFTCLLGNVLPAEIESPFLLSRASLQYGIEGKGGPRIGEVADHGQGHGIAANNMRIIQGPDGEILDIRIEDSKTGHSRYVDIAGTAGGLLMADLARRYWAEAGFEVETGTIAGMRYSCPDFWVVRFSLKGFDESRLGHLLRVLQHSASASARGNSRITEVEMVRRMKATGPKSSLKKYVNVAGGPRGSPQLASLITELKAQGYGDFVHFVPGPLILSTSGKRTTLMPLSSGSTFDSTKSLLTKAAHDANAVRSDPDPQIDMTVDELLRTAKWGTHSFRHMADKLLVQYCKARNIDLDLIKVVLGWEENKRKKEMVNHYDQTSVYERVQRARITLGIV